MVFWNNNKRNPPVKDVDFDLVDERDENDYIVKTSVKILTGKYEGVVYSYGKVSVNEEEIKPTLKYQYVIEKTGKFDAKKLHKDKKFVILMGDILVVLLENHLNIKESNDTIRTDDSEESDLQ